MSCSVAVSNSPMLSPSMTLFCNKTSSSPSSPRPSSPFRFRLQKTPSVSLLSSSPSTLTSSSDSDPIPGMGPDSVSTILKRKRPSRLDLPAATTTTLPFGVPTTAREVMREVEREGYGYSVYCKKGRREAMEDRFTASVKLQGDSKQAFFGVFDGHGGAKAAEFAAQKLEKNILDEVVRRNETMAKEAVKAGYSKTDAEFLQEDVTGGTCCVTALIRNGNLVVSNAGDCRAVLSKDGVAEALTSDHRPSRVDERKRIETSGGYVDLCHGVWRVQGSLAVSRGIGDHHLKQWVIAEPETKIMSIKPEHEFLVLASDGLWDKVSNQEAVDIARASCVGINKPNPLLACKKLVDLSVSRGSSDDTSVMLIQLGQY